MQPDTVVLNPQALNRYAYVDDNPLRYTDPSGHLADTLLDVGFIAGGFYDICSHGLNRKNGLALTADVGCALLPFVTGGGLMVRAATHADDVSKVARVAEHADETVEILSHADKAANAVRAAEHLSQASISLERFRNVGRKSIPRVLEAFGDASRPMGENPKGFENRRVTTLGRTWDIETAKELGGFRVLDLPQEEWSIERNYGRLMEAIENGDVFYLASPVTEATLTTQSPRWGGVSVYMRELDLLLQAGYRRVGDYLIPPR